MGWTCSKNAGQQNPATSSGRKSRRKMTCRKAGNRWEDDVRMMAPNCSVRKNWHIAARHGSEWTKRTRGGGHGQETGRRAVGENIIIIISSSSSSNTYSGADPGFARPEAYTISGVLFTKNNTKLSKK